MITPEQSVAVITELQTANNLLKLGLALQRNIDAANDFIHGPMLLLSNGLERILKITLCLCELRTSGTFPTNPAWARGMNGHNITRLTDDVARIGFSPQYLNNSLASADKDYLLNEPVWRQIIIIFSNFGQAGRYHDVNTIINRATDLSPIDEYHRLESIIFKNLSNNWEADLLDAKQYRALLQETQNYFIARIEQGVRAIFRLYTLGDLGPEARQLSAGTISDFLTLRDDELGKKQYRVQDVW